MSEGKLYKFSLNFHRIFLRLKHVESIRTSTSIVKSKFVLCLAATPTETKNIFWIFMETNVRFIQKFLKILTVKFGFLKFHYGLRLMLCKIVKYFAHYSYESHKNLTMYCKKKPDKHFKLTQKQQNNNDILVGVFKSVLIVL